MSIYQDYKPEGDSLYLKLKDGDRAKLRIVSEPAMSVYNEGDKPRYSWIVFNRELKRPQIYTSGISVFSQIADLTEEWGNADEFDIIIKRTGSGLSDTSYSVTPVKQSDDLTKEQLSEINKIDLLGYVKGKWLAEYVDDNELPDPIMSGLTITSNPKGTNSINIDTVHEMPEDMAKDFGLKDSDD